MDVLREAFAKHHALQCGFCTPGMLMTARDIVTRLPDADEKRIRLELSGNLCRCTGYVGIVEAVQSALKAVKSSGLAGGRPLHRPGRLACSGRAKDYSRSRRRRSRETARRHPHGVENFDAVDWASIERDGVELRQSFAVPFPRAGGLALFRRSRSGDALHARGAPHQAS